jgi:opacity protein-like surface antigen
MKHFQIIAAACILVSTLPAFATEPALGLRSEFGALLSSDRNNFTTATGGLAVTYWLSGAEQDEISLGVSFAKLDYGSPWLSLSGSQDKLNGRQDMLLSGYRHYFRPRSEDLRFFCGLDAGLVHYSGTAKSTGPLTSGGSTESESDFTRWRPAVGASLGIEYNFTRNCSLQAFYRYLLVSELGDFSAGATSRAFHIGQDRTHALLLALNYRF